MTSARATVVIVNYNGAHLLPACLDGLRGQDLPGADFRTVVVDNASTDGSLDLLADRYPWVRVIPSGRNLGFAGGNNLALRQVDTPYAVLLNNDAVPEPGWLAALLAGFDRPGGGRVGAVTGKVLFLPRFVRLCWECPGGPLGRHDPRPVGARVHRVEVDGRDGVDVTDSVLWEDLAYGPEGTGESRFRWARPAGSLLVPLPEPPSGGTSRTLGVPVGVRLWVSAPADRNPARTLSLSGPGGHVTATVTDHPEPVEIKLPAGTPCLDVVNNAGGIVLRDGYGADRGFQQVDQPGQPDGYDRPEEVFTACGNGMALRVAAGREAGWFDERFFLYYEDTDLSWRLRAAGWSVRYEPAAVLRHVHSASAREWSPVWQFHVERNRLLMLTKNATGRLALAVVARYPLTAASLLVRSALESLRPGRRFAPGPHLVRARVVGSYLRLLGPMLATRWRLGRAARVGRTELERWLTARR
ncbi:MAG TPA: glycosyltransferase [Mycobacteriales bacterium]|nr:glycosyltransferase [Mycobacteriales bacterium]